MAIQTLKQAFTTDVAPILARRAPTRAAPSIRRGLPRGGYRARVAEERPAVSGGGGGIV